jgi:hypothetical protein
LDRARGVWNWRCRMIEEPEFAGRLQRRGDHINQQQEQPF